MRTESLAIGSEKPKERLGLIVFNLSILLAFILPHTSFGLMAIHALLPIVLFFFTKWSKDRSSFSILILVYILGVFIFNVFLPVTELGEKDLFRLAQYLLLIGLFPFVDKAEILNLTLYIVLSVIVISQLAYVIDYTPVVNLVNSVYFSNEDIAGISYERYQDAAGDLSSILGMRYGGIYGNANQYGRFLDLWLVVYLIENQKAPTFRLVLIVAIVTLSTLLTGSRTALGTLLVILFFFLFSLRKNRVKGIQSTAIRLLGAVGLIIIPIIYVTLNALDIRSFDLSSGLQNSLEVKWKWLLNVVLQIDFWHLLFGSFTSSNVGQVFEGTSLLDSEWGEALFCFGVIGLFIYIAVVIKLLRRRCASLSFYLVILLWGISSTVFFNFRMSLLFMLFLSKYYTESKSNPNQIKTYGTLYLSI